MNVDEAIRAALPYLKSEADKYRRPLHSLANPHLYGAYRERLKEIEEIIAGLENWYQSPGEPFYPGQVVRVARDITGRDLSGVYAFDPDKIVVEKGSLAMVHSFQRVRPLRVIFHQIGSMAWSAEPEWIEPYE